jgi:hypothetical protein
MEYVHNFIARAVLILASVGVVILVLPQTKTVRAQSNTGTILGTVTDSSGVAVADARVSVRSIETGHEQSVTTDGYQYHARPCIKIMGSTDGQNA